MYEPNFEDNKNIKIPYSHYIGVIITEKYGSVGTILPDGTDYLTRKKKKQIDDLVANSTNNDKEINLPRTMINVPMSGFRILNHTMKFQKYNYPKEYWDITDPRGFSLKITSWNLEYILSCALIENGEIIDKCVWAREKSENILIPVTSKFYKTVCNNTDRLSKKVNKRNIKIGNKIVLHDGKEGIYLGDFYPILKIKDNSNKNFYFSICIEDKKKCFIGIYDENINSGLIFKDIISLNTLKISECIEINHDINIDDSKKIIFNFSRKGGTFSSQSLMGVITKKLDVLPPILTEISWSELLTNINKHDLIIVENTTNNNFGILDKDTVNFPDKKMKLIDNLEFKLNSKIIPSIKKNSVSRHDYNSKYYLTEDIDLNTSKFFTYNIKITIDSNLEFDFIY